MYIIFITLHINFTDSKCQDSRTKYWKVNAEGKEHETRCTKINAKENVLARNHLVFKCDEKLTSVHACENIKWKCGRLKHTFFGQGGSTIGSHVKELDSCLITLSRRNFRNWHMVWQKIFISFAG
jgi:hypothetical protein